jgi:hypothetical protein
MMIGINIPPTREWYYSLNNRILNFIGERFARRLQIYLRLSRPGVAMDASEPAQLVHGQQIFALGNLLPGE